MRGSAKKTRRASKADVAAGIKVTTELLRQRLVVVKAMTAFGWVRRESLENVSLPALVIYAGAKKNDLPLILEAARRSEFKMTEVRLDKRSMQVVFRPWMKRGRKSGVKVGPYKKNKGRDVARDVARTRRKK